MTPHSDYDPQGPFARCHHGVSRELARQLREGKGARGPPIPVLATVPHLYWQQCHVLATVPRFAALRRYHVRRLMPSASHGRSASLLPSGDALSFLALPICIRARAACRASQVDLCPCRSHFRRYLSTDRAMPATSEPGSGSRPYTSATSRFSACAMVRAGTLRSPRQVAMNKSWFRPIPVWAMRCPFY